MKPKFQWRQKVDFSVGQVQYLASGRLTDIEIICESYKFTAHKLALSAASGFFNALSDSSFVEGQTSSVRLDEDDPAMIARLLLFVYASTYPTTAVSHEPITQFKMLKEPFTNYGGLPQEWVFRAKIHAQMYSMADKYDMPLLKAQARQRFLISFYKRDKYDSKTSRIVAGDDNRAWANIANIISYVYTEARSPDSGLRDIVLSYYTQQMNDPNTYRMLIESAEVATLATSHPDFAVDVALHAEADVMYDCLSCHEKYLWYMAVCCNCGKVDSCEKQHCKRKAQEATFCTFCYGVGCLVPQAT